MSSYTKVFTQLYDMIIWYGMVRYDNNMIWDMVWDVDKKRSKQAKVSSLDRTI